MAQTDGHGGQQIESDQWANLVKYFIETMYIFWYTTQVFGHGWLCHPTSRWGRFSEIFNLSTGFVIQEIKVQTLINFYYSLYQ